MLRTAIIAVALTTVLGSQAAYGEFSALFTLSGDAADPAKVFPLTPLTITVADTQTYGTEYWNNDISRLQLNWSDSSSGLNPATGASWAWGTPVLGLIAPPPDITINDTDLSDGVVNIQNAAGITIAPVSPFTVGVLTLSAPAYNPVGGNTHTLYLTGGSYDDETLTAVIDVMPAQPGDPNGVLLAPPSGTGLTLSTYTLTVVPGGKWTGGTGTAWQTPGNWSSAMAPGPTFTAVFDSLTSNQPALTKDEAVTSVEFRTGGWNVGGPTYTLTVGSGGITSSGAAGTTNTVNPTVNLTGNTAVSVGPDNTLALAAVTGASGALAKSGAGTLELSGAGSYGGGTTVSEGTVLVTNTTGSGTGTGAVTVGAATLGGTGFIN
ncbi:MAG: autotransporter-associated beta strand repeat-containing protein, partial [Planctomycetota bacterium]|nr:autotransporter-associated beta strand repeat-containing protein [Planctomycetota bacterium]